MTETTILHSWLTIHETRTQLRCPPGLKVTDAEFYVELKRQLNVNSLPAEMTPTVVNWDGTGTKQSCTRLRYIGSEVPSDIIQFLVAIEQIGNFTYVEEKVFIAPPELPSVRERKKDFLQPSRLSFFSSGCGALFSRERKEDLLQLSKPGLIVALTFDFLLALVFLCPALAGLTLAGLASVGLLPRYYFSMGLSASDLPTAMGLVVLWLVLVGFGGGFLWHGFWKKRNFDKDWAKYQAEWQEAQAWNAEADREEQARKKAHDDWFRQSVEAAYLSRTNDVFGRLILSMSSTVKDVIKTLFVDRQAEIRDRQEKQRTQQEIEQELEKRRAEGFKIGK